MDTATTALAVSMVTCLTNLLGFVLSRDRRTEEDAIWRGEVNGKLDVVCGIKTDVDRLQEECRRTQKHIAVVEASAQSAHHRIDELARELHMGTGRTERSDAQ